MPPSPSRHIGYSHSRRSLLLQHQPGCQRSQNQLAKRNNADFSLEASSSSSDYPATPSAPDSLQQVEETI